MRRFTMVLAAAVATAMLVIAVSALAAVGAAPPAKSADDLTARLADCLRDRGVAVPALTGDALDRWLQSHRIPDAEGRACKEAVAPPETREAPSMGVKQLSDCLRAQGLDVPTDPVALKQWIGRQRGAAAQGAIAKCGVALKPEPAPKPCGAAPDDGKAARHEGDAVTPET
jgi:hypothetical protein